MEKLSRLQKNLLMSLYDDHCELERLRERGVPAFAWCWGSRWRTTGESSVRASLSRALKRLEDRGLVLRQNEMSGCPDTGTMRQSKTDRHNRTTAVQLLPVGVDLAKRLTKKLTGRC
jgi:hypothetical protein